MKTTKQSSLNSFFKPKNGGPSKSQKQQSTLTSMFAKNDKGEVSKKDGDKKAKAKHSGVSTSAAKRRKMAIVDDSDSEDEHKADASTKEATNKVEDSKVAEKAIKDIKLTTKDAMDVDNDDDDDYDDYDDHDGDDDDDDDGDKESGKQPTKPPSGKSTKTVKTSKASKNATTTVAKPDSADGKLSDAVSEDRSERQMLIEEAEKWSELAKVPSNDKLEETTANATSPLLYSILVETLDKIEAITGRLDIQALLTDLIRRVLLVGNESKTTDVVKTVTKKMKQKQEQFKHDMYPVLYLASNTVAPAYECVELGIGDSILIKAIGEAYGTKPAQVKQRYEEDGDLGTVAMSYKSKQATLSFGIKPRPLTCGRVLSVFRTIASISGSSSQKLKVDAIKKLLVQCTHGSETKFIIRGLQGKLRIGLAASTVLISLAHALCYTIPSTVDAAGAEEKYGTAKDSDDKAEDDEDDADDDGKVASAERGKKKKRKQSASAQLPSSIIQQYQDPKQPIEKHLEAAVAIVKQVYSQVPSYDALLDTALTTPLRYLPQACSFQPGIPVVPMLAKPTKSIKEVLKRLEGCPFTCEYKYDGERAQIHLLDGQTKVFSRNLLETTGKYPEVPLLVQEAAEAAQKLRSESGTGGEKDKNADGDGGDTGVTSFVLDAEVVAYNAATGQLVPFQILSTRKRTEESATTAKVKVIVQAFDLMFLNGQSLLSHPLQERRRLLRKYFSPVEHKFQFATSMDFGSAAPEKIDDGADSDSDATDPGAGATTTGADIAEDGVLDTAQLQIFLDEAVKGQCEGLMVKTLEDVYEPSRRSLNWLKLKKDYLDGLGDSFDLVPLGAYHGRGKRTGFYGAYLLACYDPDSEEYQSVCKIGTGFSDEDLKTLSASLNEHRSGTKSPQYNVADGLECDVWFDACQVWEIKAADLSKSSLHRGAIGKADPGRGIGLRFPRFERIREDKNPCQATTSDQVLEMYYQQDSVIGQQQDDDGDDGI